MKYAAALVIALLCSVACALAHDYARPELKSWFMGLHSQQGTPCCDGEDAVHIEDADWDTTCEADKCHYRVRLEGKWYVVPEQAVVTAPNRSGTALVWPIRYGYPAGSSDYVIRCFMPGTGM